MVNLLGLNRGQNHVSLQVQSYEKFLNYASVLAQNFATSFKEK